MLCSGTRGVVAQLVREIRLITDWSLVQVQPGPPTNRFHVEDRCFGDSLDKEEYREKRR